MTKQAPITDDRVLKMNNMKKDYLHDKGTDRLLEDIKRAGAKSHPKKKRDNKKKIPKKK